MTDGAFDTTAIVDIIAAMSPDEILEFAIELSWFETCVDEDTFQAFRRSLWSNRHLSWREAFDIARNDAFVVCQPQ